MWLTSDGVPVLDHDGVVKGRLGRTRRIGELTRSALPLSSDQVAWVLDDFDLAGTVTVDGVLDEPAPGPRTDTFPLADAICDFPV